MKKLFPYVLLTLAQVTFTMAYAYEINTYNGVVIDASSIRALQRLEPSLQSDFEGWLSEHRSLIEPLLHRDLPLSQGREEYKQKIEFMAQHGITNTSVHNFMFPAEIAGTTYFVKITGLSSRMMNIGIFNNPNKTYDEIRALTPEEVDAFAIVPTIQTISRKAHDLLMEQYIALKQPRSIDRTRMYAVSVPWGDGSSIDEQIVVFHEALPAGAVPLEKSDRAYTKDDKTYVRVTHEELVELFEMTKYTGSWINPLHEIFFYNGTFYEVDTEQPNNSNPEDFFHRNRTKFDWNVMSGLGAIALMLEPGSESYQFFKELVLNDPDIQQNQFYALIVEKFTTAPVTEESK